MAKQKDEKAKLGNIYISERLSAIDEVKKSILRSDGYVINFNMFSDLAMSLSIEITEAHVTSLHAELKKVVTISDLDPNTFNHQSPKECLVLVNVSFTRGTGNMKHEKPMVDG